MQGVPCVVFAQPADTSSLQLSILFPQNVSAVDTAYAGNAQRINTFVKELLRLEDDPLVSFLPVITIHSSSSPEGITSDNDRISRERAQSLQAFLRDTLATSHLANATYKLESAGEDWEGLIALLQDSELPYAQDVVQIIQTTPYWIHSGNRIVGSRKKTLMDYKGGSAWKSMSTEAFPQLRSASAVSLFFTRARSVRESERMCEGALTGADTLAREDTLLLKQSEQPVNQSELPLEQEARPAELQVEPAENPMAVPQDRRPIIALKTNLLADAVTAVNLGVELPIGQRFSIEANAYFPWWYLPEHDITMEILAGAVEGRYWFGDRTNRAPLTGWSAGIYMGAGMFDLQRGNGIQGELFIMGGLSAGYAHQIARNLRLEYSIGIGYIRTDYREYEPAKGTQYGDIKVRLYPWEEKRFSGVMPTKASVSLVWTISSSKR